MAKREVDRVYIKGNELRCPICNRNKFWKRKTLMNTSGATFFGFDWLNREAINYICDYCGYIYWFWEE